MISLKDIKTAVNTLLTENFTDIDLMSTDVKEGFNRPSFFVKLDNMDKKDGLYSFTREMTVRIYYFPTSIYDYSIELLEKQSSLESIFNLNFSVGDRVITIDDTPSDIVDGVLEFDINFSYSDSYETEDTSELMEELEYTQD
jgi:hypothetical protein